MSDAEIYSAIFSAFFAGISAIAAVVAYRASENAARKSFRLEWTCETIGWGEKCVFAMSRAHDVGFSQTGEFDRSRSAVLTELSAMIDIGRFFFENKRDGAIGLTNPRGYQGFRPDLLTYVVRVHEILVAPRTSVSEEERRAIVDYKRRFVSDLQEIVEPNWFSRTAGFTEKATDEMKSKAKVRQ